jgi:ATP-dependent RNA helicase RhlE
VTPQVVTVDRIEQRVFFIPAAQKHALLFDLLKDEVLIRVIVFTRTKSHANRVTEVLQRAGVSADVIHGNKSQNARQRALERFRTGDARVLVATDIAARGIDVDDVSHVVNFELPDDPESYVHRIGRTARAGKSGIAFSFCDASERGLLRDIERLTKRPLLIEAPRSLSVEATQLKTAFQAKREPSQGKREPSHGKADARKPDQSTFRRRRQAPRGKSSKVA